MSCRAEGRRDEVVIFACMVPLPGTSIGIRWRRWRLFSYSQIKCIHRSVTWLVLPFCNQVCLTMNTLRQTPRENGVFVSVLTVSCGTLGSRRFCFGFIFVHPRSSVPIRLRHLSCWWDEHGIAVVCAHSSRGVWARLSCGTLAYERPTNVTRELRLSTRKFRPEHWLRYKLASKDDVAYSRIPYLC